MSHRADSFKMDGKRGIMDGMKNSPVCRLLAAACFLFLLLLAIAPAHAESPMPGQRLYALPYVGEMGLYKTAYEDTFVQLARNYNLGFVELRAANPHVDPWLPGEGTEIILPTRHLLPEAPREGIVINLPEQRLYVFVTPGEPPVTYPIGVGRTGLSTPVGRTTVVRKKIGPVWRPTARMREEDPRLPEQIGPGLDNPMGTHALYLGWPEYAIHGTNKPFGIGRRTSSGCIRLYPEDIVTLYDMIPEGTKVTVVDQPIKVAWIGDELFLEAHPTLGQSYDVEESGFVHSYEFSARDMEALMKTAGRDYGFIDWQAVRDAVRKRKGYPVRIAARPGATAESEPAAVPVYGPGRS